MFILGEPLLNQKNNPKMSKSKTGLNLQQKVVDLLSDTSTGKII